MTGDSGGPRAVVDAFNTPQSSTGNLGRFRAESGQGNGNTTINNGNIDASTVGYCVPVTRPMLPMATGRQILVPPRLGSSDYEATLPPTSPPGSSGATSPRKDSILDLQFTSLGEKVMTFFGAPPVTAAESPTPLDRPPVGWPVGSADAPLLSQ